MSISGLSCSRRTHRRASACETARRSTFHRGNRWPHLPLAGVVQWLRDRRIHRNRRARRRWLAASSRRWLGRSAHTLSPLRRTGEANRRRIGHTRRSLTATRRRHTAPRYGIARLRYSACGRAYQPSSRADHHDSSVDGSLATTGRDTFLVAQPQSIVVVVLRFVS